MFLADTVTGMPSWMEVLIGPFGLLVGCLIVIRVLWSKSNAKDKKIDELQEARMKDLATGITYREEVSEKVLKAEQSSRDMLHKMGNAISAIATQLERNNVATEHVSEIIRQVQLDLARGGGGSTGTHPGPS